MSIKCPILILHCVVSIISLFFISFYFDHARCKSYALDLLSPFNKRLYAHSECRPPRRLNSLLIALFPARRTLWRLLHLYVCCLEVICRKSSSWSISRLTIKLTTWESLFLFPEVTIRSV